MLKKLKQFRQKKWVSFVTNLYVLILSAFLVWMFFFDTNSFLIQKELRVQIENLEAEKEYLEGEIDKDRKALKNLSSDEAMENSQENVTSLKRRMKLSLL